MNSYTFGGYYDGSYKPSWQIIEENFLRFAKEEKVKEGKYSYSTLKKARELGLKLPN